MIIKIILTSLFLSGIVSSNAKMQSTGSIIVEISGIEEQKGVLYISIYDTEQGFPSSKASLVKTYPIKATKGNQKIKIPKMSYGIYAISCFHDVNSNNKLDTNFLDIPKEKVGSSNNPTSSGPPIFKDAKFQLNETTLDLQISLN